MNCVIDSLSKIYFSILFHVDDVPNNYDRVFFCVFDAVE